MNAPEIGLRARLQAEAEFLDLLRGDDAGDLVLHVQSIRGRWTVELLRWVGERRQIIGRGATFAEAWRAISEAQSHG